MANESLGANFSIDVTNLKAGLAQANRLIRESESEFKAAAAGMDDWSSSSEGLEAKISSLTSITDIQKKKVTALQSEYDRLIAEGLDPASKEAVELRTKINNETTALNKNEAELKKQKQALKDMGDSSSEAGSKAKSLKQIVSEQEKELKDLESQYKKVVTAKKYDADAAADLKSKIDTLTSELEENKSALDSVKKKSDETGDSFNLLSSAGSLAVKGIAALATACATAVTSFFALAESTREARTNMAQLETAFETAGHTAEDASSTYKELYSVFGDDGKATEAATHLALVASNTEQLSEWTNIATGVYAKFNESIPIEGLTEAANESAKTGTVTGNLADAINWAADSNETFGVSLKANTWANKEWNDAVKNATTAEDFFNLALQDCSTEQERQALIASTLTDLYGESAEAYRENNAAVIAANEAQADLNSALNELGEIAEPVMTTLKQLATEALSAITPFVSLIGDGLAGAFAGADGAADKLAEGLTGIIDTILQMATDALPVVIETIVAIVPRLLQSLLGKLPTILSTLAQMLAQVISSLGSMLPQLIPTIVEAVLLCAETLLDNIDLIIDAGIALLTGLAEGLINALPILIEKAPVIISKLVTAVTNNAPKILAAGVQLVVKLAAGLIQAIPQLAAKVPELISTIVSGLSDGISSIYNIGVNIVEGLWNGINDMTSWIAGKIQSFCSNALDEIKDFFGIASPSRVMADEVGKNLALGIGEGFEDNIDGVNKTITDAMDFESTPLSVNASGKAKSGVGGVVVNQVNNYAQSHSRYELYKTKQNTAAAVRLAMAGG